MECQPAHSSELLTINNGVLSEWSDMLLGNSGQFGLGLYHQNLDKGVKPQNMLSLYLALESHCLLLIDAAASLLRKPAMFLS